MTLLFELIFWVSICGILYAFAGYPLLLAMMARVWAKPLGVADPSFTPRVSLLISAYNEAETIGEKLDNALASDYPRERLDIVVVSDASSDGTDEIVRTFSEQGVRLLRQDARKGKTAALNHAVPQAAGDIIVFSDANAMYDRAAIRSLAVHFQIPEIGFVTGITKYMTGRGDAGSESIGLYSRLELLTKRLESRLGSCVGADGAIFAVRKDLYRPLSPESINDFVIPLNVVELGFRGIVEPRAFCIEYAVPDTVAEFRRQVRITARAIRALVDKIGLLNPAAFPLFSFQLLSHKIFKFMLPLFMVASFAANIPLMAGNGFYLYVFILQSIYYSLVVYGFAAERKRPLSGVLRLAFSFAMVGVAMFFGWIHFLKGETYLTWTPQRK